MACGAEEQVEGCLRAYHVCSCFSRTVFAFCVVCRKHEHDTLSIERLKDYFLSSLREFQLRMVVIARSRFASTSKSR